MTALDVTNTTWYAFKLQWTSKYAWEALDVVSTGRVFCERRCDVVYVLPDPSPGEGGVWRVGTPPPRRPAPCPVCTADLGTGRPGGRLTGEAGRGPPPGVTVPTACPVPVQSRLGERGETIYWLVWALGTCSSLFLSYISMRFVCKS